MSMRNYRGMTPENADRALRELQQKQGEAYDRLVQGRHGGLLAYDAHVNAAEAATIRKGGLPLPVEGSTGTESLAAGARALSSARCQFTDLVKPIPPMLAWDSKGDFGKVPERGWVMEPKFDGHRWQVHILEHQDGPFVASIGGRNGKRHDGEAPRVDKWLLEHLPANTVLDGEMLWEDGRSSDSEHARFVAFDVLICEGVDIMRMSWADRRHVLEDLLKPVEAVRSFGPHAGTSASPPAAVRLAPAAPVDDQMFNEWIDLGVEGCVAKREAAPYVPGSRRQDGFIKVKPQATTDAIVVGYVMGKGASNKDRVGALEVMLVDTKVVTTCAYDCTPAEAEALNGRRIELAHYGWFESGNVRHPIFGKLRPDLEPVS